MDLGTIQILQASLRQCKRDLALRFTHGVVRFCLNNITICQEWSGMVGFRLNYITICQRDLVIFSLNMLLSMPFFNVLLSHKKGDDDAAAAGCCRHHLSHTTSFNHDNGSSLAMSTVGRQRGATPPPSPTQPPSLPSPSPRRCPSGWPEVRRPQGRRRRGVSGHVLSFLVRVAQSFAGRRWRRRRGRSRQIGRGLGLLRRPRARINRSNASIAPRRPHGGNLDGFR